MPRTAPPRAYGKKSTRTKAERMFSELPQSPHRKPGNQNVEDTIDAVTEKISIIELGGDEVPLRRSPRKSTAGLKAVVDDEVFPKPTKKSNSQPLLATKERPKSPDPSPPEIQGAAQTDQDSFAVTGGEPLRILSWDEVCPPGGQIEKIAEASYAEVYRVSNERGTSIIKVIRLDSPIKAQTKMQVQARLVDEEPRSQADIQGELQISEWLADIPGFVVYKERYLVNGKGTKELLDTHQKFQRRLKRQDPRRIQFYPSPSRYLDSTKFLVVELGDAGTALEDWKLKKESELWDIFFLEAIALARAEDVAMFEHRDLHEGNLCVKQTGTPRDLDPKSDHFFGHSGIDITILDYGLSRAEDLSIDFAKPVAYDFERDLSLFTSDHAQQCNVYRQMRSFLLRADRLCLPAEEHHTPYAKGIDGPLSWEAYAPYTNVLWLAYLYQYLINNFTGDKKELAHFKKATREMWKYLNPDAEPDFPCFGSAEDIVCFAVEAGWVKEEQLMEGASILDREDSIILPRD